MAKTTAPLLSLGAGGSIAKTVVFSKWRGIPYVRQHVTPANPNTTGQQDTRNVFRTMTEMWKLMPTLGVNPWDAFATGRAFLGRNAYIGQNVAAMRGLADQDLAVGSPGARGGLPPTGIVITTVASLGIEVDATSPALPSGWTITTGTLLVWPDQDPAIAFVGPFTANSNADPSLLAVTGLTAVNFQVRAWLVWAKPDASVAYSVALAGQILVTA